eukprot:scaffold5048_cov338-Prasinococcus_capsulatus_cf.AAC.2
MSFSRASTSRLDRHPRPAGKNPRHTGRAPAAADTAHSTQQHVCTASAHILAKYVDPDEPARACPEQMLAANGTARAVQRSKTEAVVGGHCHFAIRSVAASGLMGEGAPGHKVR